MKYSRAFTIIELIFVIVIVGIIAGVAIPKLVATKDDAKAVKIVTKLKLFIEDVKSYYTANGENAVINPNGAWGIVTYDKVTKTIPANIAKAATTGGEASFNIGSNNGEQCFNVTEATQQVEVNGIQVIQRVIEVTDGTDGSTRVCQIALQLANQRGLHKPGTTDIYVFAAQQVTF